MAAEIEPLRLRIFVSSPMDVQDERLRALALLKRLPAQLGVADRLQIDPVLWDDPSDATPMALGQSAQSSVDYYKGKASDCDLVIAIFSGRIGSRASLDDGTAIESGSIYEVETARASRVPVWIYRDAAPTTILPGDSKKVQSSKLEQFNRVEAFFKSRFQNSQGQPAGAYTTYRDPADFEHQLEQQLRADVLLRLDLAGKPYCVSRFGNDARMVGRETELKYLRALVQFGLIVLVLAAAHVELPIAALKMGRNCSHSFRKAS